MVVTRLMDLKTVWKISIIKSKDILANWPEGNKLIFNTNTCLYCKGLENGVIVIIINFRFLPEFCICQQRPGVLLMYEYD